MENLIENVQSLCRLCGSKTKSNKRANIFDTVESLDLSVKITVLLCLEINENDTLPQYICNDCVNKLVDFDQFKELSHKTNLMFQNLIKTQEKSSTDDGTSNNLCETETLLQTDSSHEVFLKIENPSVTSENTESDNNDSSVANKVPSVSTSPGLLRSLLKTPNTPSQHFQYSTPHSFTLNQPTQSVNQVFIQESTPQESESQERHNTILEPEIQIKVEENDPLITKPKIFTNNFLSSYQLPKVAIPKLKPTTLPQRHKCGYCVATFHSRQFAIEHINLVHAKSKAKTLEIVVAKEKVQTCNSEPIINIHADNVPKTCSICNKTYPTKLRLDEHIKRTHNKKQYPAMSFICEYCNKELKTPDTLRLHLKRHKKDFQYICSYCSKGYVDNNSLQYHIRSQHTKEYPFQCTECNKKFMIKDGLNRHMIIVHTDGKNHQCDICFKSFKTHTHLHKHKQIHIPLEMRKKFTCSICDKLFLRKSELKKHIIVLHLGKLPHKCHICKNRYGTIGGLKVHLLLHSGVKNFVCDICGKAFALPGNLKVHVRTHSGVRPYECKVCGRTFTQSSTLNLHSKKYCSGKK